MGNVKGMIIHIGFDVQGLAGRVGGIAAYFNYWQGGPLKDFDMAYRTEDGHVSVGQEFIPISAFINYPDFQLFMPYEQLHMAPGGVAGLMCQIYVWDKSQNPPQVLANSVWIQFYYSE